MTTATNPATNCTAAPVFTRDDYMSKRCTFLQYYAQFVTSDMLEYMKRTDITLESRLAQWDALAGRMELPRALLIEAGEISPRGMPSLCCHVCVAKTAYRMANGLLEQP